jgi:hypothetical protein
MVFWSVNIFEAESWKHAVGEVLLIFVGISLALAADEWNDRRLDRKDEFEFLSEIVTNLQNDLPSIKADLAYVEDKITYLQELSTHIRNGLPYSDSLADSFSYVRTWQTTRLKTAAFEALKYRGLDVVSDRVLRINLIDFYDGIRVLIEDRDRIDRYEVQNYVEPYFQKHFVLSNDSFRSIPIDYETVVQDQNFLNLLALRAHVNSSLTVPAYRDLLAKTNSLISQIENHLDGL